MTLQNGHAETVRAHGELLKLINNDDILTDLIAAKGMNGIPGVYNILEAGDKKTVTAFRELLTLIKDDNKRAKLIADIKVHHNSEWGQFPF